MESIKDYVVLLNRRSTYVCNEENFSRAQTSLGIPDKLKFIYMDFSKQNIALSMINQHPDVLVPFCAFRSMPMRYSKLIPVSHWNTNTYMYFAYLKTNTSRSLKKLKQKIVESLDNVPVIPEND